jgi:hypothetical protein
MIVVVSTLAIPLGSLMWQMTGKAVDLEEKALARQMALGVQANINAYGAFSKSVDYSVPDVVSTRGATLTAILTWDKNVTSMGFLGPVNTGLVANPQRMAAYRIDVERLANPDLDIEAASLTFLTGVVFSEVREADLDLVYAAVPSQKRIFAIHPIDHDTWDFFDTATYTPLHLAVHPNGGWLAIKCPQSILLMDIRADSDTLGSFSVIYHNPTSNSVCGSSNDDTTGDENTRLDRGIVFRSDGKYLYFTNHNSAQVNVLQAPSGFPPPLSALSPQWSILPTPILTGGPDSMELVDGEDGFLYWAFKTIASGINRMNTHTHATYSQVILPWTPSPISYSNNQLQRGVTTSWDGGEILYWNGDYMLGGYLSHAPTHFWAGGVTNSDMNDQNQPNGLLVSRDNRFILGGSSKSGSVKHLYAWNRREYNTSWNLSTAPNIATKTLGDLPITSLVHNSYGKEVIADTTANQILFINVASFVTNSTTPAMASWTPDSASGAGNVSAVAARVPEIAWIACADGTVRTLDIFGGQNAPMGGRLFGIDATIGSTPLSIALTAGGDQAIVCNQGSGNRPVLIDALAVPPTFTPMSVLSPYPTAATATVAAFTQRGSLIVGFQKTAVSVKGPGTTSANGFLVYPAVAPGALSNIATCGYALPSNFVVKQIVPFNRREGALILFQDVTSTPKDAIVAWVEPSAQGGTAGSGAGGDEGQPNWRILAIWEGKYDGFPEGAPYKMALSPDDTLLAMLDLTTTAGNTKNVIRLYDLTNQRFPMQQGMGFIRYDSPNGDFTQPPVDSPIAPKTTVFSRFNSQLSPTHPANFWYTSNNSYFYNTIRHFGYWYAPSNQRIAAISRDGIRLFVNGSQPPLITSTNSLWNDPTGISYYLWEVPLTPSVVLFQPEFFNSDAHHSTMAWGWSNSSLNIPSDYSTSGTFIATLTTPPSSSWNLMQTQDFRVFRFRPQLLHEIAMDGSTWEGAPDTTTDDLVLPNLIGGNEGWYDMCFHRDTGRPTLFLISHDGSFSSTRLSGLGLFGSRNWGKRDSLPNADIKWNMSVSPDGRRLILVGADSAPRYLVHLLDIAYPFPWAPPNLATVASVTIDLPAAPIALAVRPFNSFTSKPDTIESFSNVSGVFVNNRCGNQTAALARGGIYLFGGSDGHAGTVSNRVYKYNPVTHSASTRNSLPVSLAHASVVSYDDQILVMGGCNTSTCATVYSYDVNLNSWGYLKQLQSNNNTDYVVSQAATSLTPYGIVLIGGENNTTTADVKLYYPQVFLSLPPPPAAWGETLAMASLPDGPKRNGAAVCHFSRKDKKWYLYLIGGGDEPGSHDNKLIRRFDFDNNNWASYDLGEDELTERTQVAACSWGDEIFIYGGCRSNIRTNTGIAYNPDTGKYRVLAQIGDTYTINMSAVPAGPCIYLIDGCDSANNITGGSRLIRRYSP